MKQELLKALNKNRAGSRPVAVATLLDTGEQWLIDNVSDGGAAEKITALTRVAIAEDKSQIVEFDSSIVSSRHSRRRELTLQSTPRVHPEYTQSTPRVHPEYPRKRRTD